MPGLVRIESLHRLEFFQRSRATIFLINNATRLNHECFHTRDPIVRRRRAQPEPSNNRAADHKIHLSLRSNSSLSFQDLETVAVKWLDLVPVTLLGCFRDGFPGRPSP